MLRELSRRELLGQAGAVAAAGLVAGAAQGAQPEKEAAAQAKSTDAPFRYCLNMSTIRGQKLSLPEQVEVAAKAGYDAIEPWIGELRQFVEQGGRTAELKKQIEGAGLTVESAIGFAAWIVDDDAKRAEGLEAAKSDMDLVAQIGGKRIAAPPAGATDRTDLNLLKAAERYRALLEIGDKLGVVPQVEVWGFSKSLSRLGETAFVAIESGHPRACILPDIYHLYKGGSDYAGLGLLSGGAVHVLHMNDYPSDPPRTTITDAHRVYPGDGIAPLNQALRTLHDAGFRGALSLELFNTTYWRQNPLEVAKTGLAKMKAAVQKALG